MAIQRRRRLPRVEERQRATRRQLVATARRLFARRGVFEVPIEDIAHAAAVGKGTVYLYFTDRDALLAAALEGCLDETERWIAAKVIDGAESSDRSRRMVLAYLEFFRRRRDATRLLLQVRGLIVLQPGRRRALSRSIRRHLSFLEARLLDRSRLSRTVARPLAVLIFGAALGIASMPAISSPRRGAWTTELERGLADWAQSMAVRMNGAARAAVAQRR